MIRERHYYLYAKGHYKRIDLWEDLSIIQREYCLIDPKHINCLIDPKHITAYDIIQVLAGIVWDHIDRRRFIEVFHAIGPHTMERDFFGEDKRYSYYESVVEEMLSILREVRVFRDGKCLLDLGEADFSLLPENEDHKKYQEEMAIREKKTEGDEMAKEVINIVYIGDHFFLNSGTMMSSIYRIEDSGAYRRFDWAFVSKELREGKEIHIRPATDMELDRFTRELQQLIEERKKQTEEQNC